VEQLVSVFRVDSLAYGLGVSYMTLHETILAAYPELEGTRSFMNGTITLQNDSDGLGDYIAEWNYSKKIPDGLKLGK
jgi:hypothetical protein